MEISVSHLKDMLDSISRFHFLFSNVDSKYDLVQTYCQEIDEILHVLEPVVDEIISNEVALDEQLNTLLEDLSSLVNAATERMEKWNQLTSKVWFVCSSLVLEVLADYAKKNLEVVVLQIEELVANIQVSVLGFCKALGSLFLLLEVNYGTKYIDQCIEKIQSKHYKETSTVIREAMCSIPSPDRIVKIAHFLSLLTVQELFMERIALDNLKQNIDHVEDHGEMESINSMIKLISHMHYLFIEKNQVKSINSVPVPADICCPLSLKIMSDPVIVASGQTYERAFIRKWLDQGLAICPKSWQVLSHTILIPNDIVKVLIANWCQMNNIKLTDHLMQIGMNQSSRFYELAECSGADSRFSSSSNPRLPDLNGCKMIRNEDTLASDGSCQMTSQNEELKASDPSPSLSNSFREDIGTVDASKDKKHGVGKKHYDPKNESSCHSERCYLSKGAEQSHVHGISSASSIAGYNERKISGNTFPQLSTNPSHHISNFLSEMTLEATPSPFHHKELETSSSTSNTQSRSRSRTIWLQPSHSFSPKISSSLKKKTNFSGLETRVRRLIEELKSDSVDAQRAATSDLLALTRHDNTDNRLVIANCGAIAPLISLLHSLDMKTQETAVTALLNLSINDNNKSTIAKADAIDPLIHVLKTGSPQAKQNSAIALYNLSLMEENKVKIGRSGAIAPLVELLGYGNAQGKKDASTALYNLSSYPENKAKIVQAGAVKHLVELMDPTAGMVDRAVAVLANLATIPEGRSELGQKGGIPALVDVIELGSSREKENAAAALLHLCTNSNKFCKMVLQEGAVPPLMSLLQSGTLRAKKKAQSLLDYLRSQRHADFERP